jgi:hypothetical protein
MTGRGPIDAIMVRIVPALVTTGLWVRSGLAGPTESSLSSTRASGDHAKYSPTHSHSPYSTVVLYQYLYHAIIGTVDSVCIW